MSEEKTGKTEISQEDRARYGKMSGMVGLGCNVLLAVMKLVVGLISGMVSIIADSINNFADSASSIVSLIGFRLASKPADEEHPFGHARYEYISGLVVAFMVLIAAVELLKTGVDKILHPTGIEFSTALFVVLVLSIAIKLGMAIVNYGLGKRIKSQVVLATAADSRNDVIGTSAVLIAAVISYAFDINLDGYMSVIVALFVLISGINLVRDALAPLLGTTPDPEFVKQLETMIISYDSILGIHDLIIHDYGPGRRFASVHAEVSAESPVLVCHEIIDRIELDVREKFNMEMVIHYDPIVTSDEKVGEIRAFMTEKIKEFEPSLSLHDLRIVPGENNTNVIFDLVIPFEIKNREKDILHYAKRVLRENYPNHSAVITVDHSYV